MSAGWIAALAGAIELAKKSLDLIEARKQAEKELEAKATKAVKDAPDPTPPKE